MRKAAFYWPVWCWAAITPLALALVALSVVTYYSTWDVRVPARYDVPFAVNKSEVSRGDTIRVFLAGERYAKSGTLSYRLQLVCGSSSTFLNAGEVYGFAPGPFAAWGREWTIPKDIPPGRCHIQARTLYQDVNWLGVDREAEYETQEFTVN